MRSGLDEMRAWTRADDAADARVSRAFGTVEAGQPGNALCVGCGCVVSWQVADETATDELLLLGDHARDCGEPRGTARPHGDDGLVVTCVACGADGED